MMTKINDIIDFIHGINPMYNTPDFVVLLRISSQKSFVKAFSSIIKRSLAEIELKVPLFMWDKTIAVRNGEYTFTSNFDLCLKGEMSWDMLELVPTSILHYTTGLLTAYRDMSYIAPKMKIPRTGRVRISYYARYPIVLTKDEHEDKFTDDAIIYGITEADGSNWTYFMYILEYNLLMYLRDQKSMMTYQDMPLEFLTNVDSRISEIQTDLQDLYSNPIWYSNLYM